MGAGWTVRAQHRSDARGDVHGTQVSLLKFSCTSRFPITQRCGRIGAEGAEDWGTAPFADGRYASQRHLHRFEANHQHGADATRTEHLGSVCDEVQVEG